MPKALDNKTLLTTYRKKAKHYDFYHGFVTMGADQRGRKLLVKQCVKSGFKILDAGGGTGTTAIMAAKIAGDSGRVTLLDLSKYMIDIARKKAAELALNNIDFMVGDLYQLPFEDNYFDTVLSSYSTCPLANPEKGVLEMLRVLKPGSFLGIAHSTEPDNKILKWMAQKFEQFIWLFPSISLGCRAVKVLPALLDAGANLVMNKKFGVPLYPFRVIIVRKPLDNS